MAMTSSVKFPGSQRSLVVQRNQRNGYRATASRHASGLWGETNVALHYRSAFPGGFADGAVRMAQMNSSSSNGLTKKAMAPISVAVCFTPGSPRPVMMIDPGVRRNPREFELHPKC